MGIQDFFRMKNVFGGGVPKMSNDNFGNAPAPLPSRQITPNYSMSGIVPGDDFGYSSQRDTPVMDAFSEHVLNPPTREKSSWARMLGTGALSALQGSTGPKSRVPVYNAAGKVVGSKEAGFWESLGNEPFDVAEATSILDIPHDRKVEDWKLAGGGMKDAAVIESQMARNVGLPEQRMAQAKAIPEKVAQGQQAQDRQDYLASLKDMPESLKLKFLQEGKIDLQDLKDSAAMERVTAQQTGATERTEMQQTGATERTGMQQTGAMDRTKAQQTGATERTQMGGAQIGTIPDPSDPTKSVGVWYNPRTGKMERVSLDGQGISGITRPGIDKPGEGTETPQELAKMEAMRTRAQETIIALQGLIDDKGNLKPEYQSAVGKSRILTAPFGYTMPGSKTREANIEINNIKANMLMGLISEMKSQSKTGATGFGQLAVKEVEKLESAASKLDPNLGEAKFTAEVARLIEKLQLVMKPANKSIQAVVPGGDQETREQRAERLLKLRSGGR